MSPVAVLKVSIMLSAFLYVFALALRARAGDLAHLFRRWHAGLRAFAAMFLVVPAITVAVVAAFDLKPEVEVALLVLSLSPVPPMLPAKQLQAGAGGSYIVGLLVAAALASLLVMPLGLHLLGHLSGGAREVPAASVALPLATTVVAPMLLGLAAGRLLGDARATAVAAVVGRFALVLLLGCAAVLLLAMAPDMWRLLGGGTLAAVLAMILAGLVTGYLLGGPVKEHRAALALAAATRHPGVALGVVAAAFPGHRLALAAVLIPVVLNVLVGIPFLRLVRRVRA